MRELIRADEQRKAEEHLEAKLLEGLNSPEGAVCALVRIEKLIADIKEHPFIGIGKPEPLRHEWSGYWSRRITKEHRLIYRVETGILCPVPFSLRLREESRQQQRKPIPNLRTRQKI